MDKTRIIVVEDNIVYCEFVCNLLAREGFRTVQAYHLSTAKKLLQQASDGDIVVSDLRLPDGDGIDLLRWMRKEGMTQPLIIMTNYAEVHTAVESMKLGSLDYIPKQLVEDKLMPLLHTILKERSIGRNRMPVFARDSSAFQKIMQQIRLVAPTDMSVLIFFLEKEDVTFYMELFLNNKHKILRATVMLVTAFVLIGTIFYVYMTFNPYYIFLKHQKWEAKELDCVLLIDEYEFKNNRFFCTEAEAIDSHTNGTLKVNGKSYKFKVHTVPNLRHISFESYYSNGSKCYDKDEWSVDGEISIGIFSALFNGNVTIYIDNTHGNVFPDEIKKITLVHN